MRLPVGGERHERAVEAAIRVYGDPGPLNTGTVEEVMPLVIAAYFAELQRLGVRLVEQPKCPECAGGGFPDPNKRESMSDACQRCGGSGYEPLVPLGELEEWLRDAPLGYRPQDLADEAERRFGGGER